MAAVPDIWQWRFSVGAGWPSGGATCGVMVSTSGFLASRHC